MKPHLLSLAFLVAALSQIASAQSIITAFVAGPLDRPDTLATTLAHSEPKPGSEIRIRMRGDTAVLTGWFVTATNTRESYSAVWVRRGEGWRLASEHPARK